MTNLLLFLLLVAVIGIQIQLKKLTMTQPELAQAIRDFTTTITGNLDALGAQLLKALDEIIHAVGGEVSPELQEAFDNMKSVIEAGVASSKATAQQLDDINPDETPKADRDTK
jgi:hypothetical protein